MNWSAIGAIGEILGALAVFVSLIYLGAQIRANTRQSKAAMASGVTVEQSRLLESLGRPDLAEIAVKILTGAEMSDEQHFRWHTHLARTAHVYAAIQTAHENGQIDDGFYADCQEQLKMFMNILPSARKDLKSIVAGNHPSIGESGVFRSVFAD